MNFAVLLCCFVAWSGPGPRPALPEDGMPKCCRAGAWAPGTFAAESTHSYDVRLYRLDFSLPMTEASFTCHEQVLLKSEVPSLDTFSFHFDSLVCDSVQRNGVPLSFTTPPGFLSIQLDSPLPQGESTTVHVFFHREPGTPQRGFYFGKPPAIRYAHAMTCGCPRDNRCWFACFDEPLDKAEHGICINLTLPDTFQTCTNGMLDSVTSNTDGTKTWWWRHSYPIATYLMTFSASRFAKWDTLLANSNGDTIPFINWMWPEDSAVTHQGYRRVPQMMEYYVDTLLYGPYPFEKFGHVPGYYGFPWGGMEHQTLVMLHPSYIGGGHESTIAHELSHMWWGDMVTHVDFRHVWLNEGFATYSECICLGHLNGRNYFNTMMRGKASSFFSQDRSWRFPMFDPPDLYNPGNVYCKGAWVQHMLRWVVGDTAWENPSVFFRGMRAYGDSFKYGTVSTADYCQSHEQVSGLELDWFFDEWVYQAGFPRYSLDWTREVAGDSFRVITTLSQDNGSQAPDFFRTPLPVRVNCQYSDTLVCIRPEANPQVDTFVVADWAESLTVDPDNWILDSCYLTGIAEGSRGPKPRPRILSLAPNPAAGQVRFELCGPPNTDARVMVFDRSGRAVAQVSGRYGPTGRVLLAWERDTRIPAGIYFCRLVGIGDAVKLVLLD